MKAQFKNDILVLTTGSPTFDGVDISDIDIPIERMRLVEGVVVDANDYNVFYIDKHGQKHLVDNGYQKLECSFLDDLVLENGVWVVCDPIKNSRYSMILSAAQVRLNLAKAGMLIKIIDLINAMPDDEPLKILWEYATVFNRLDKTLILFCKEKLGMDDDEIDGFF
jgi:hypothetical protein